MKFKGQAFSILAAIAVLTSVLLFSFLNYGPFRNDERDAYRIEVILKSTDYVGIPFWGVVRQGLETAAEDMQVDLTISGPQSETEITRQIKLIREAIERKPDAIVLAAADFTRLVPIAEEITDNGILLVTIDSFVNSDAPASRIGTDNYSAGFKAGLLAQDYIERGSSVAILSYVIESSTAIDREKGTRESLAGYADIVGSWYSGGNADAARKLAEEILTAYPDIEAIIALNEPSLAGSAGYLAELPADKRPVLIGIDNSPPIIKSLEQEIIQAIIVQKPFNMGYLGVAYAVDLIEGKPIPKMVDTGAEIITKETMYTSENQKLLFPVNRE